MLSFSHHEFYNSNVDLLAIFGGLIIVNAFAGQSEWSEAALLYRTVLNLQAGFEPARQRLKAVLCAALQASGH